ncbi:MAG: hypothetical protein H6660_06280 [Ardenticatenaceae bacterium]|nr:hypothetical protein [Ardenticatenaceae bacterium]
MSIWDFNRQLTQRLLAWAVSSITTGAALQRRSDARQRGIGLQFAGWGIVNLLIALFGKYGTQRRARQPQANTAQTLHKESRNLRRLLWINTGLDVLYVLGGLLLARRKGHDNPHWRGQGQGIIVQGGFLFFFDLLHALLVPKTEAPRNNLLESDA